MNRKRVKVETLLLLLWCLLGVKWANSAISRREPELTVT